MIGYLPFHEIPIADYLSTMTELANHEENRELEAPISNHAWKSMVAKFQKPDAIKATWQVINSAGFYALTWLAIYLTIGISVWLTLGLALFFETSQHHCWVCDGSSQLYTIPALAVGACEASCDVRGFGQAGNWRRLDYDGSGISQRQRLETILLPGGEKSSSTSGCGTVLPGHGRQSFSGGRNREGRAKIAS